MYPIYQEVARPQNFGMPYVADFWLIPVRFEKYWGLCKFERQDGEQVTEQTTEIFPCSYDNITILLNDSEALVHLKQGK